MHGPRHSRLPLWAMVLAWVVAWQDAAAIVVRHDRDEAEFRQRGERYPAVVHIHPAETGTLVHPRFVLTAAHVAESLAQESAPRVTIGRLDARVVRIYLHPEWKGRGAHDIALLELDAPVRTVSPVRLFRQKDEKGLEILFVGYGDTGTGLTGPDVQDGVVRAATNRVDDVDEDWLYFTFNEPGEGATDWEGVSGPGDSGGPALLHEGDNLWVLGVSAFSFDGKPGRYGTREAYTRVSMNLPWLDGVLSGDLHSSGLLPGRPRQAGAPGGRAVTRTRTTGQNLADVTGGPLVQAYLDTYNQQDGAAMATFIQRHFSTAYRKRQSAEVLLAWYGNMLEEHFGTLSLQGVTEATPQKIVVRIQGANGRLGELHVRLDAEGRIDDLQAALIDTGP